MLVNKKKMNIELKLGSELGCSTTWPGHVQSLAGVGKGTDRMVETQRAGCRMEAQLRTGLEPSAEEAEAGFSIQAF